MKTLQSGTSTPTLTNYEPRSIHGRLAIDEKDIVVEENGLLRREHVEKGETKLVLTQLDEHEDPKNFSKARKWLIVLVISSAALCTASASSIAAAAEAGEQSSFHVSEEVAILGISLYVEGLGVGPLLLGPLSEFYGRNPIYIVSYTVFLAFSFPVAFAPNISVFLVFRFLTGFVSSAFLSVAGGSVSDLFTNENLPSPMAFYTLCPFAGPVIGPLISGFINQHLHWRWTYYIQIIWTFVEVVLLFLFVPETYLPALLKTKAKLLRRHHGIDVYTERELASDSLVRAMVHSCYKPFQLLVFDHMAFLLDLWSALVLGILYLAFQAFPIIFGERYDFNKQMVGCSFLGIGVGLVLGTCSQYYFTKMHQRQSEKHDGNPPPETRLLVGMPGGILVTIGLYILAFTTISPRIPWAIPLVFGSIPFGTGLILIFDAVFTYLVTAYRDIAASAMAANSMMRMSFAAVFPLFARAMYERLGTVGATALLAGLCTIMVPVPFVFYSYGARIRAQSKFALS